jgi:Trk-type K+ transport system membrane component
VAPSATYDRSLYDFEVSGIECLTKYSNVPTTERYLLWLAADISWSPFLGRIVAVLGPAVVL